MTRISITAMSDFKEKVRDLFSSLVENGYVDLKTGKIESRCEPSELKAIFDLLRQPAT